MKLKNELKFFFCWIASIYKHNKMPKLIAFSCGGGGGDLRGEERVRDRPFWQWALPIKYIVL